MSFEDKINQQLFTQQSERSWIDKLLAKKDVDDIRDILKKEDLSREDLLILLYDMAGTESKLLNLSEYERQVILLYFAWIRSFVQIAEGVYNYETAIETKKIEMTEQGKILLKNIKLGIGHNAKYLIDLYFNICRTSLSIGATALLELLKSKFEISYPQGTEIQTPTEQKKPLLVGLRKSK